MNLAALPDDQSRMGYSWTPPFFGARAMAEHLFYLNNVPYEVLRKFTRDDCIEFADVLAKIGTDTAHQVIGWMEAATSFECETQIIRSTYVGRYGDAAQEVVDQALNTMTRQKAETLVQQYFPDWRSE